MKIALWIFSLICLIGFFVCEAVCQKELTYPGFMSKEKFNAFNTAGIMLGAAAIGFSVAASFVI
jgi:hypothetical protein